MARTSRGRELTEEHRVAQVRLGERLTAMLVRMFLDAFEYESISASVAAFAREAAPEVLKFREASRMLSIDYLGAFRDAEVREPDREPVEIVDDDFGASEVVRQLLAAGAASAKTMVSKGYSEGEVAQAAAKAAAAKGMKLAQDGGRNVIEHDVKRGNGPVGYARVVDASPCPFCAMLASRGVSYTGFLNDGAGLYRSDSFADSNARFVGDGRFKVHDGCSCTLEPVYYREGKIRLPGNGDQLAREWAEVAAGQDDPEAAWRRWRESGTLPENYDGPLEGVRRRARPVAGQRGGKRLRKRPAKASERKVDVKQASEYTAADYLEIAAGLRQRMAGVDGEIRAMEARGMTERDIPLLSLQQERRALLSRIERYENAAKKMT